MILLNKRHFSLIEISISLALTILILSSLSYFFYQTSLLNLRAEKQQNELFKLRYAETRLSRVLTRAIPSKDPQKDFFFFTNKSSESFALPGTPELLFTFDNCVNLVNPLFSNHVLGRLFVDKEKNLTLAIAPSRAKWNDSEPPTVQREILLENVEELSFNFFVPSGFNQTHSKKTVIPAGLTVEEPEIPSGWTNEWKYNYYRLPVLIKIELKQNQGKKRIMLFPFPKAEPSILYQQGGSS